MFPGAAIAVAAGTDFLASRQRLFPDGGCAVQEDKERASLGKKRDGEREEGDSRSKRSS